MDRWSGKVAIVTGASQGIGAAITESLLDFGVTVVGLARSKEKLTVLAQKCKGKNGKFFPIKVDVSKEEDLLNAFKEIKKNIGPIHILINNAGAYAKDGLLDGTTEGWKEVFDTNVLALCVATREAIKNMRDNDVNGHIIHIGSIVFSLPKVNVYVASKQAVNALTETLRQELNSIQSKIKVSVVNPGTVRTPLVAPMEGETNAELLHFFETTPKLDAADIANAVAYILSTPPHVQVHELTIRPIGEQI